MSQWERTAPRDGVARHGGTSVVRSEREFAFDWIDRVCGTEEYRRIVVLSAALAHSAAGDFFAEPGRRSKWYSELAQLFRVCARTSEDGVIASTTDLVFAVWSCRGTSCCRVAISAAQWIARHTIGGVAPACVLDTGAVLINCAANPGKTLQYTVRAPFRTALVLQPLVEAGEVCASSQFRELAESFDLQHQFSQRETSAKLRKPVFRLKIGCSTTSCVDAPVQARRPIDGGSVPDQSPRFAGLSLQHTASPVQLRDPAQLHLHPSRAVAESDDKLLQTGQLRRIAMVASVFGYAFTPDELASVLGLAGQHVAPLVQRLLAFDIIVPATTLESPRRFELASEALRSAAYTMLPVPRRRTLHLRIAHALQDGAAKVPTDRVLSVEIASHLARGGEPDRAIEWWCVAGREAVWERAPRAAITILRGACESLIEPEKETTKRQFAELCRLLAMQLAKVKGNAAQDVFESYTRCLGVARSLERIHQPAVFDAQWGLLSFHLTKGNMKVAVALSRNLLRLAQRRGRPDQLILAHRMAGLAELLGGRMGSAQYHLSRVVRLYDQERDDELKLHYGSDQLALAHAQRAWAYSISGPITCMKRQAKRALVHAERQRHAHTLAHVAGVLALAHETRGDHKEALAMAMVALAVAEKHDYPYWRAWARIVFAAVEVDHNVAVGAAMIERALHDYRATGAVQALPYAYLKMARAQLRAGKANEAESTCLAGISCALECGLKLFLPELQRTLGQAKLACGRTKDAAGCFKASLVAARRIRARRLEEQARAELGALSGSLVEKRTTRLVRDPG